MVRINELADVVPGLLGGVCVRVPLIVVHKQGCIFIAKRQFRTLLFYFSNDNIRPVRLPKIREIEHSTGSKSTVYDTG